MLNQLLQPFQVGDIYISLIETNPSSKFGGVWEKIEDAFLLGASNTYGIGTKGGSSSHTHSTANHTLTVNEIPSHYHNVYSGYGSGGGYGQDALQFCQDLVRGNHTAGSGGVQFINNTGGSGAHNHGNTGYTSNIPPYLAVYMYKKVA